MRPTDVLEKGKVPCLQARSKKANPEVRHLVTLAKFARPHLLCIVTAPASRPSAIDPRGAIAGSNSIGCFPPNSGRPTWSAKLLGAQGAAGFPTRRQSDRAGRCPCSLHGPRTDSGSLHRTSRDIRVMRLNWREYISSLN